MALSLFFTLLFLFISSTTSIRTVPPAANSTKPVGKNGPIMTNGRPYAYVCDPDRFKALSLNVADFLYCNTSASYYDRVDDIIGRMRVDEKLNQMSDYAKGVERIGLPYYAWWGEILHGVSDVGHDGDHRAPGHATWFGEDVPGATQFPEVINSAASFNESLWRTTAEIVSTEARAMYNLGHTKLTFWSPVINLVRDPRWGRILETPGEDPVVVGKFAVNFVRGLQDVEGLENVTDLNTRPIKVGSCCKHFGAYDLESWFGMKRFFFDALVSEQDMVESFNLPFEMCLKEGDTVSVMCSYNKVNGIPACGSRKLLTETFRGEWNLHGYIVSDCDAVQKIYTDHKFLDGTPEDAVALGINSGLDLECGTYYEKHAMKAIEQGKIREKDIDNALRNLYMVLMRLGFFDGMPQFNSLGLESICSEKHIEMSVEAARQGMVLLKNKDQTLPLSKEKIKKLAIGGPHVHATEIMLGNYAGRPCRFVSPLKAFKEEAETVDSFECFDNGKPDIQCRSQQTMDEMKAAAKGADSTVLFMGIDLSIEREFQDRENLSLPDNQIKWINEVAEASPKPIVLVILSAGGVDISFARDNPKVGAILWAGYPGQEGGRAIADVVYGRYNPGGRLPITWYTNDYIKKLPMTSMAFRPVPEMSYPGRTYKFFNGSTVFPFGHGLSYTVFKYILKSTPAKNLDVKLGNLQQCLPMTYKDNKAKAPDCPSAKTDELQCQTIAFEVEVKNEGKVDGSDAIIVYSKPPANVEGAPIKQVVAFQRVFVKAGESAVVKFSVDACKALALVEKTAYRVLASGEHTIKVGSGDGDPSFPVEVKLLK